MMDERIISNILLLYNLRNFYLLIYKWHFIISYLRRILFLAILCLFNVEELPLP